LKLTHKGLNFEVIYAAVLHQLSSLKQKYDANKNTNSLNDDNNIYFEQRFTQTWH